MERTFFVIRGALGLAISASLCACAESNLPNATATQTTTNNSVRVNGKAVSNLIYEGSEGYFGVFGFPQSANGNVTPVFDLSGSLTKIYEPEGFAIAHDGAIAISDANNQVTVYPAHAEGNIAPSGAITCGGPDNQPVVPQALAYDAHGTLYAHYVYGYHADQGAIEMYPAGNQTGCVTNANMIDGSSTGISEFGGIAVDRNVVYQATANAIIGFKVTDSGNVPPDVQISGTRTGLLNATDLAFDASGRMYVSEAGDVRIFARSAHGNAKPVAVIAGNLTGIPAGDGQAGTIAVAEDGTIFVGVETSGLGSILVFAPGSNGNVAPQQIISGSNTDLGWNFFLGLR